MYRPTRFDEWLFAAIIVAGVVILSPVLAFVWLCQGTRRLEEKWFGPDTDNCRF